MHYAEDSNTMFEYYDTSSDFGKHDAILFMKQVREDRKHWAGEMAADMQAVLHRRRVLEVACGYGRWTRFAAEVADYVLATDYAPKNLAYVSAQGLPADKVGVRLADAYKTDEMDGSFNAGLHMNFLSHVPKARTEAFLDSFHRKLGPGAVVFMGTDHCGEAWMQKIYTKPGSSDIITLRERQDGSKYEIINNIYNERTLRDIFEPKVSDFHIRTNKLWWWAWYTIR